MRVFDPVAAILLGALYGVGGGSVGDGADNGGSVAGGPSEDAPVEAGRPDAEGAALADSVAPVRVADAESVISEAEALGAVESVGRAILGV